MKKIKIKILLLFILVMFTLSINSCVYAASYSAWLSASTLTAGNSTTLTIRASNITGMVNISSSNTSVASVSTSSVWIENNTVTATVYAKSSGSCKIIVSPNSLADSENGADVTSTAGTKSLSLTVKAKTTTTTTTTTTTKSSNNYLSVLKVNIEGLTPNFNKYTNNYSLTVGSSVTKLGLIIRTESAKATYYVTGNSNFVAGDNIVKIVVTAENKTTRVYKIIVTKAADITKANAYLSSVLINGVAFQEFDSKKFEYKLKDVENDITSVEIKAFPESKNATAVITGASNFKEGKNTIVITVTAEDKKTKREYIFEVNRLANEKVIIYEEENTTNTQETGINNKNKSLYNIIKEIFYQYGLVLTLYMLALVQLIQIIYLYKKVRELDPDYDKNIFKRKEKEKEKDDTIRRKK